MAPPPQTPGANRMASIIRPSARDRWMVGLLSYYTPEICETTARSALSGNVLAQWLMFDLMEQTSPRINKNLNELKRGVIALDRIVQPFALKGQKPSAEAVRRAVAIEMGLKHMQPRPAWNENDLDDTIYDVMDAVGKGISVLDVDWQQQTVSGLGTLWCPRATRWVHPRYYGYPPGTSYEDRLMLNTREVGLINPDWISQQKPEGLFVDFPEDQFIVSIIKQKTGHPLNASMLRVLGFWWAAQNFTWDWFLRFAQIFGAPFVWAQYDQGASAEIDKILDMLDQLGGFGRAAFPAGTQIDFKEAITQGTNNPQYMLIDAANTVFDLVILGQTLTSQTGDQGKGGGSYSLGQVHAGVRGEKIMATARQACKILNHTLLPAMSRLNFGDTSECPTLVLGEKQTVDALQIAERDQILQLMGVPMVKTEFYERHDLSIPSDSDQVIGPEPDADDADTDPDAGDADTGAAKAADDGEEIRAAIRRALLPLVERRMEAAIKQGFVDGLTNASAEASADKEGQS